MDYYVLTRDGVFVALMMEPPYQYAIPGVSVHKFSGTLPDLNSVVWDETTDTFIPASTTHTKLAFLTRMTTPERIAIRGSTDPVVEDIMALFDAATYISTVDPNTITGINYLVSVNLLTTQRGQEILS